MRSFSYWEILWPLGGRGGGTLLRLFTEKPPICATKASQQPFPTNSPATSFDFAAKYQQIFWCIQSIYVPDSFEKLTIEKGETVCTGVSRKDFLKITVLRERNGNKKLHSWISGNGIFQWEGKFEAAIKIWFKRTIPHYNINIYQHIISYHFLHSPRLGFLIPLLWRVD